MKGGTGALLQTVPKGECFFSGMAWFRAWWKIYSIWFARCATSSNSKMSEQRDPSQEPSYAGTGYFVPPSVFVKVLSTLSVCWHRWETYGICAILGVLVFLVFGQTMRHGFFSYDDIGYVNQDIRVSQDLTFSRVGRAFVQKEFGLYNPLVTVSHMLDRQIYGLKAGGHHLTNVLLHFASVLLLFFILRKMTGATWPSAFVAALFAIHPLRVESVAWISERKDVLSGLFFMLTLGAYLRYVQRPGSGIRYSAVLVLFILGLMSKPMLVTVPFVLLLLDYWPLNRLFRSESDFPGQWSVNWWVVAEKIPLMALSFGLCLLTMLGPKPFDPNSIDIEKIPFLTRMSEVPVSMVIYLGQMFWPVDLAVVYPHSPDVSKWWPAAVALLVVLSLAAFFFRRRHPYLWMGWLWNLGMLVPVSGIVQISRHWRADHYTYLPQIGLYIGLIWMAADRAEGSRSRRLVLSGLGALAVGALSMVAYHETSFWRNSTTLWTRTVACTQGNFIALTNLGNCLVQEGQIEEGIALFRNALEINANDVLAHNNLGMALVQQKRIQEGISSFREALKIKPACALAHNNLGMALFQLGEQQVAIAHFREAFRINPGYAEACYNMGTVLFQQGKTGEAIVQYREALRLKPDYEQAHNNLGNAFIQDGKTEEAVLQFRESLKLNPSHASAHYNLATLLMQKGQTGEAVVHFREALGLDPSDVEARIGLGTALFQQRQSSEAIAHLRKVLELQPANVAIQNSLAWMLSTAPLESIRNGEEAVKLAVQASQSSGGNNPLFVRTLAAAYAAAGDFSDAVPAARKALELAETQGNADLASKLHHEIELYEAGHPFQEGGKGQER